MSEDFPGSAQETPPAGDIEGWQQVANEMSAWHPDLQRAAKPHLDTRGITYPTPEPAEDMSSIREVLVGLNEVHNLSDALQTGLADQVRNDPAQSHNRDSVATALAEHNIFPDVLQPDAAPDNNALAGLDDADWEAVRTSSEPLISVWSRTNVLRIENDAAFTEKAKRRYGSGETRPPQQEFDDQVRVASLPLVHGTSFAGLLGAVEQGSFRGNREIHDQGIDVSQNGNTIAADRELGLDQFVFADFARPNSKRQGENQPDITVVLKPEAMDQPGTFVTEHDVLDLDRNTPGGRMDYTAYMRGGFTSEDFRRIALTRLRNTESTRTAYNSATRDTYNPPLSLDEFTRGDDGDPDQTGAADFSTWEVKMPEVTTDNITRIVFKDQEQMASFIDRYGDRFECVYEPQISEKLRAGEDVLGAQRGYEQAHSAALEADYTRRASAILEAPEDERTTSYSVMIGTMEGKEKYNPDWLSVESGFNTEQDALEHAQNMYRSSMTGNYEYGILLTPAVTITQTVRTGNNVVTTDAQPYKLQF
jgi:hypothetical protein